MMVEQGRKMPLQVRVLYFRDCIPNSFHHMCPGHLPIVPGNEPFRLKKLIQAVLAIVSSLRSFFVHNLSREIAKPPFCSYIRNTS